MGGTYPVPIRPSLPLHEVHSRSAAAARLQSDLKRRERELVELKTAKAGLLQEYVRLVERQVLLSKATELMSTGAPRLHAVLPAPAATPRLTPCAPFTCVCRRVAPFTQRWALWLRRKRQTGSRRRPVWTREGQESGAAARKCWRVTASRRRRCCTTTGPTARWMSGASRGGGPTRQQALAQPPSPCGSSTWQVSCEAPTTRTLCACCGESAVATASCRWAVGAAACACKPSSWGWGLGKGAARTARR